MMTEIIIPEFTDVSKEPRNINEVHSGINWKLLDVMMDDLLQKQLDDYRIYDKRLDNITISTFTKKCYKKFENEVKVGKDDSIIYRLALIVHDIILDVYEKCYSKVINKYKKIEHFHKFPEYNEAKDFIDRYDITTQLIFCNIIKDSEKYN